MAIGIDIGSTGIKLVQVGGLAGRIVVSGAGRWIPPPEGPDGPAGLSDALRALAARAPRPPTGAVIGLTGRDVNLQYVSMPPVSPHIFRNMMRHEMEQAAGPTGDEMYVDYDVTAEPARSKGREGEYSVVIGRAKRQVVEDRLEIARHAGLSSALDACPNAIALYQAVVAGRQVADGETALAIDLGAETLEFVIVQGRQLLFARNVSSGAQLFTEAIRQHLGVSTSEAERLKVRYATLGQTDSEATANLAVPIRTAAGQFANIVQSSIAFARIQLKRPDLRIARCLLSGGGARLRGLQAYLQGALGVPVIWNEPFKAMDCAGLPDDAIRSLQATPTDMVLALGLALTGSSRGAAVRLSLLPAGQKQGRARRRRVVLTAAAALLYGLGLGALTAATLRDQATVSEERKQVEGLIDRYGKRIADYDEILRKQAWRNAQAQLLRNEVIATRALMETLARLQHLVPDGLYVTSIALDRRSPSDGGAAPKGNELKVRGVCDEGSLKAPHDVLRKIASELGDPGSGITAEASQYKASGRPGWNEFELTVIIPQFAPAPPKGDEEAAEKPADAPPDEAKP